MSLRFARFLSTTPTLRANYGFIGLGQMGQHMARHIYAKMEPSDKLYVFDTVPEATASFVDTVTQQKPEAKSQLHTLDAIPKFVTDVDAQLDFIVSMVPEESTSREW
ncbi:hypothetical protein CJJ09_004815 [Candidozyma auris]|nr:hypothetical protein CJJ09_004815 [[Candida] auris]